MRGPVYYTAAVTLKDGTTTRVEGPEIPAPYPEEGADAWRDAKPWTVAWVTVEDATGRGFGSMTLGMTAGLIVRLARDSEGAWAPLAAVQGAHGLHFRVPTPGPSRVAVDIATAMATPGAVHPVKVRFLVMCTDDPASSGGGGRGRGRAC